MPTLQQKAKGLAAKKLSGNQFNYDNETDIYTTQNQNAANARYDQLYNRQLDDARATQRMSLWDNANQRGADITRGSIAAGGQVGAAQASAAASVMEQSRLNKQYAAQENGSMGLDAKGNVMANTNAFKYADGSDTKSFSGGSESFGLGAAAPDGYSYNAYGVKSLYHGNQVSDWRNRQDGVLNDMYRQEQRSSNLDRDKQAYLADVNNRNQVDMMNRQSSINAQQAGNDRAYQGKQADKDRANQRYLAQLEANSRLQQSIFSGNGNGFQYWGGSI